MSFGVKIPFVDLLGFELLQFEGGQSQIHFAPRPEHFNSFDVTHGGVLMTLLDVAMATAARSVQKDHGVVTIEMKTSFMRPAKPAPGAALLAQGRLLHRTTQLAFTEATVFDDRSKPCAHATGTFKYLRRAPSKLLD